MEQKTILIIDDSEIVLAHAKALFEAVGHKVVTHTESLGLLTQVVNAQPDVIILDLNMPNMGGEKVIEVLRRFMPHKLPPIVLHSSESELMLRDVVARTKVSGYVRKGESTELLERVCNLL
jgi:CheY-like chemotaxis protein